MRSLAAYSSGSLLKLQSPENVSMMVKEFGLLGEKSLNSCVSWQRPLVEYFVRQCGMDKHLSTVPKANQVSIKQRINVWRKHDAVVAIESFFVR